MSNMHQDDQFVVNHNGKWAIVGGGNTKPTKVCDTQKEAIGYAISIAKNKKSDVFVQNRQGKFHKTNSYGSDDCPPIDKNF